MRKQRVAHFFYSFSSANIIAKWRLWTADTRPCEIHERY